MTNNSAECQGGGCCSWQQLGPNRFNCAGANNAAASIQVMDVEVKL